MTQRKAEAWPPFMLEILVVFRYTTRFPDRFKCLSGDKFITRLVRRGLLKGIDEQPYFELTSKGDAAVERILSAATAIADRIAPAPRPPRYLTAKARISYPHLRGTPDDLRTEPAGSVYIDRTSGKVYSKHWCHGVPYWLPVTTPYESFMQRAFRKVAENFGGTLRDNMAQARGASHLIQAKAGRRAGLGRIMRIHSGGGVTEYVIDHAWLDLYDRFKAIGTKLHEQGRLTRKEWKMLFDVVFTRTRKLTDERLAKQILAHFRIEAREGGRKVFGTMFHYATTTKVR